MSQTETQDPHKWIKEPTEKFHGVRIVDHDGTAFIEQIDQYGKKRQSIMVTETDGFIEAAEWFANRNA